MAGWLLVISRDQVPAELRPEQDQPVFVPLGESSWDGAMRAELTLTLVDDFEYLSPGGEGTITWMAETGTPLGQGDIALRVDEMTIRVFSSETPLWRTIKRGTKGEDVAALATFLVDLGYLDIGSESLDEHGGTLARAIRAYRVDNSLGSSTSFSPDLVLWSRLEFAEISRWHPDLGMPMPPTGSVIAEKPANLASASVVSSPQVVSALRDVSGPWIFELDGTSAKVSKDLSVSLPPEYPLPLEPGSVVRAGVLRLELPESFVTAPARSIFVDSQGKSCVFQEAEDGSASPVEVKIEGGHGVAVRVSTSGAGNSPVLLDPELYLASGVLCSSPVVTFQSASVGEE